MIEGYKLLKGCSGCIHVVIDRNYEDSEYYCHRDGSDIPPGALGDADMEDEEAVENWCNEHFVADHGWCPEYEIRWAR